MDRTILFLSLISISSYLFADNQTTEKTTTIEHHNNKAADASKPLVSPVVNTGTKGADTSNALSQADLDYIKAVNDSEKRTSIESKVINNEVITKEELDILRSLNPNY